MKMSRESLRASALECTAYHEAGHAVAAWWLGIPHRRVDIIPDEGDGRLGACWHYRPPPWVQPDVDLSPRAQDWLERRIKVLQAGAIAEKRFRGQANRAGARDDLARAIDYARYVAGDGRALTAYLKYLSFATEDLLCRSYIWEAVAFVARALLDRGQLTRKEVKALAIEAVNESRMANRPRSTDAKPDTR
jgi:ATP-dependent Zn protease